MDHCNVVDSLVSSEPVFVVISFPIDSVTDSSVAIAVKPDPVAPESDSVEASGFSLSTTSLSTCSAKVSAWFVDSVLSISE